MTHMDMAESEIRARCIRLATGFADGTDPVFAVRMGRLLAALADAQVALELHRSDYARVDAAIERLGRAAGLGCEQLGQ
ncbi:MAG: hypothetical protein WAV90_18335 [Gordonia amarae]